MKCNICGEHIQLIPSAKERAEKYGGKPEDYTLLFTVHGRCLVKKRNEDALELLRRQHES